MGRLGITIIGIVAAVGLSALVFIGANKLFDLSEQKFAWFNAAIGGVASLIVFGLLWGNRIIVSPEVITLIGVALGAGVGYLLGVARTPRVRLAIGLGGGLVMGVLAGMTIRSPYWPAIDPVAAIAGLGIGVGVGLVVWLLTGRKALLSKSAIGGALGWLLGAWGGAGYGVVLEDSVVTAVGENGTQIEAIIVAAVAGLLVGLWIGSVPYPGDLKRADIAIASRKYIFLAPALFFIGATLVVPLGRTIWLGFLDGSPTRLEWTGLTNYVKIFQDPGIIDFSGAPEIFSSRLFWLAVALLILGGLLGAWLGRSGGTGLGTGFSLSAGTLTLMGGGFVLLGFAVFVAIRGTIPNNLWWIFSVTIFSVALGLAVAVLADRSRGENLAKSLIFLPMSISFVGASIIWRFMYLPRSPQDPQTGVLNAMWVQIGKWSNSSTATTVFVVGLALILAFLIYLAWRGWRSGSNSILAGSLVISLPVIWLIYRFLGPGLGGFVVNDAGEVIADPIFFIQSAPWNNFWMMIVLIWIQTGFAMVIFSAAIKAVPEELLEAARIDGATESQTFWRVSIPQIYPTIGVVSTTLIVTVLKVFDIPKVMTNGNFDTQVLANEMWERAFTQLEFGLGSALAVILFLGVLPIMFINIRRMQKERAA